MGFFSKLLGKNDEGTSTGSLYAPMEGQAVPLTEVPDQAFAKGMLGSGIAIIPTDGRVCAPCDATMDVIFTGGHAVSLITDSGAEILIHVGLDTVRLEGNFFRVHVASGDKVRKGQLLMEADLEAIRSAGLNTVTPMVVCNSADYTRLTTRSGMAVTNEDVVIDLGR